MEQSPIKFEKNRIGKDVTNSVALSHYLGMTHSDIVGSIDDLNCNSGFRFLNFEECYFIDKSNIQKRMYEISIDGLSLLVMNLDNPKAAKLKEFIMKEWNRKLAMINNEDAVILEAITILQRRVNTQPPGDKFIRI